MKAEEAAKLDTEQETTVETNVQRPNMGLRTNIRPHAMRMAHGLLGAYPLLRFGACRRSDLILKRVACYQNAAPVVMEV